MVDIMVITHYGNGAFRMQSGDTVLLLNPGNDRLKADITLCTLVGTGTDDLLSGEGDPGAKISFPGEYEVKGIEVDGFPDLRRIVGNFYKDGIQSFF